MIKIKFDVLVKLFIFRSLYLWFSVSLASIVLVVNFLPFDFVYSLVILSFMICCVVLVFIHLLFLKNSEEPSENCSGGGGSISLPPKLLGIVRSSPIPEDKVFIRNISSILSAGVFSDNIYVSLDFLEKYQNDVYDESDFRYFLYHEFRHTNQRLGYVLTVVLPIVYLVSLGSLFLLFDISYNFVFYCFITGVFIQLLKNIIYNYIEMDADLYSVNRMRSIDISDLPRPVFIKSDIHPILIWLCFIFIPYPTEIQRYEWVKRFGQF